MPLTIPTISDRKYQDLLEEALARVPVHTPEWTNFNDSDPGVTLVQLFAFLTENLLYRSNQIPERNRRKFLTLLGVPLQPATSARGLVTFRNERGPLETITLNSNLEVHAGEVPFRTRSGLDVLPVDWQILVKQPVDVPPEAEAVINVYQQLYSSYTPSGVTPVFNVYRTVPLAPPGVATHPQGVNLATQTIDGAVWIALLKRPADRDQTLDDVRKAIGGKTISLSIVPALTEEQRVLSPGRSAGRAETALNLLRFDIPTGGLLGTDPKREPRYRKLEASTTDDVLNEPGVVQLTLPPAEQLKLWDDIEPLEPGVGNLPPALDDTDLNDRLITWIRVRLATAVEGAGQARLNLLWAGINTTWVSQRAHVTAEELPQGTGQPDQVVKLSRTPVIPGSVKLAVTHQNKTEPWTEIDDLFAAEPEVVVPDPRLLRSTSLPKSAPLKAFSVNAENGGAKQLRTVKEPKVFTVNAESGEISFGDGLRGARPPFGARLRADYDYGVGRAGNVAARAIASGPALPPGFKVSNEVPTWGGADAETVRQGEKQIARYLQHRDRLVTMEDFKTITARTPGIELGRVEVLPTFHPDLSLDESGDAPGVVTLMVIPKYDPAQPDAPKPDRLFLNTICEYLNPRRLITTEVYLRGPEYKDIWISVGIRIEPGASVAAVREAVKAELLSFLSPLPAEDEASETNGSATSLASQRAGWPLRTDVVRLQLLAVANRVKGVLLVNDVYLDEGLTGLTNFNERVPMTGLQLPRVRGISVVPGDPLSLEELRKQTFGESVAAEEPAVGVGPSKPGLPLPVPVIPEECQ